MKPETTSNSQSLNRRDFIRAGAALGVGIGLTRVAAQGVVETGHQAHTNPTHSSHSHASLGTVGDMTMDGRAPIDPMHYITAFNSCEFDPHKNWYRESKMSDGRTLREYEIVAYDKEIEIAPGIYFPAWTYNGQVPGPTIRATEGDLIRIRFLNQGSHPHTMHFHGFHHANMDGVFEPVDPNGEFTYEFEADPAGLHLYHCHAVPLKRHIHKGLYGVFIIDPKTPRSPAREIVMTMNGFDTNFDNDNDVYAVNTAAFHYMKHPIPVTLGELVRIYLVNVLEFDLINSFHVHAHFFDVFRTGTRRESSDFTDTISLVQGERAVLEMKFRFPGQFMFHAHQSEFAELGWMGLFNVTEAGTSPAIS